MVGCSVYLRGDQGTVVDFAHRMNIADRNIYRFDVPISDFSFYDRQENSMTIATVEGDFDFMCDINLFDTPQELLQDRLRVISGAGIVLAIPDDNSASPFDCLLFENGQTQFVELLQDDILQEVRLHRTKRVLRT